MKRKILALLLAATMAVSTRSVLSAGAAQTSSEGSQATSTEKSGDRLSHGDYEYEVLDDGTVSVQVSVNSSITTNPIRSQRSSGGLLKTAIRLQA